MMIFFLPLRDISVANLRKSDPIFLN